jgi:phosphoserine phosphatase
MAEGVPVEVFEAVRARLDRQRDVAAILGLLPSGSGWEGRALYLAYLIATGSPEDQVAEAREAVETLRPGWLNRVRELRAKVAVGA